MSKCRYKAKDGECLYEKRFPYKEYCVEGPCPHDTPMTNADRIRAKSDEELAEYLFDRGNCQEYCYGICDIQDECNGSPSDAHCISHIVKWLQKEVEE